MGERAIYTAKQLENIRKIAIVIGDAIDDDVEPPWETLAAGAANLDALRELISSLAVAYVQEAKRTRGLDRTVVDQHNEIRKLRDTVDALEAAKQCATCTLRDAAEPVKMPTPGDGMPRRHG